MSLYSDGFYANLCSVSYLVTCEIRNFSWFIVWKMEDSCLIITYKFKNVLCKYFPENWRLWREINLWILFLNKGWPARWHLLYYLLLNMFQTLIRPSSGASEYLLCCVGWLEACWCYVAGLAVGDVVSECRLHSDTTSPTANPAT